jgi:hypothetical protein
MRIRFVLIVGTLFFLKLTLPAQQVLDLGKNNYEDKKGLVYLQENTFEINIHTNGAALGLNFGEIETYYKTKFWHVSLGELQHYRQTRQSRALQGGGLGGNFRSFVFGKQNNFFVIRGGYGEKKYFSEKARTKGVAVGYSYEGGPTLGLLKPYYLVLRYVTERPGGQNYRSEKYSEENALRFLSNENIFGADNFLRGFGEVKLRPGIHGKAALHFDWGALDEFVKAVELGIMADVFFQEVPIMVESQYTPGIENRPYFVNLFVNIQFGKRK